MKKPLIIGTSSNSTISANNNNNNNINNNGNNLNGPTSTNTITSSNSLSSSLTNGLQEHNCQNGGGLNGGCDWICFNFGKELYTYAYRGVKKVRRHSISITHFKST